MCSSDLNLLAATEPFVKSLAVFQGRGNIVGELAKQARDFVKYNLRKASATELAIRRLEERLELGELQLHVRSVESDRTLKQITLALKSLIYACLTGFTLVAGTIFLSGPHSGWAIAAFAFSGFWFLILLRSLINLAIRERLDRLAQR